MIDCVCMQTDSSPKASPAEPSTPTQKEPDRRYVTQKQMDESGRGGAFAKILASIPDNVRKAGPQETEVADASGDDASDIEARLESTQQDQISSNEEGLQEAVAAAVEQATEQQRLQSLSLDAGQSYPENTAQVSTILGFALQVWTPKLSSIRQFLLTLLQSPC